MLAKFLLPTTCNLCSTSEKNIHPPTTCLLSLCWDSQGWQYCSRYVWCGFVTVTLACEIRRVELSQSMANWPRQLRWLRCILFRVQPLQVLLLVCLGPLLLLLLLLIPICLIRRDHPACGRYFLQGFCDRLRFSAFSHATDRDQGNFFHNFSHSYHNLDLRFSSRLANSSRGESCQRLACCSTRVLARSWEAAQGFVESSGTCSLRTHGMRPTSDVPVLKLSHVKLFWDSLGGQIVAVRSEGGEKGNKLRERVHRSVTLLQSSALLLWFSGGDEAGTGGVSRLSPPRRSHSYRVVRMYTYVDIKSRKNTIGPKVKFFQWLNRVCVCLCAQF